MSHYDPDELNEYVSKIAKKLPDVVEVQDAGGGEGIKQAFKRSQIRSINQAVGKAELEAEKLSEAQYELPMNKYTREIKKGIFVDVYDILEAYDVSHAVAHAIKKLLMAGRRGAKVYVEDLSEAIQSIEREIERQGE